MCDILCVHLRFEARTLFSTSTQGSLLEAWLYRPYPLPAKSKLPVVIMGHGLGSQKAREELVVCLSASECACLSMFYFCTSILLLIPGKLCCNRIHYLCIPHGFLCITFLCNPSLALLWSPTPLVADFIFPLHIPYSTDILLSCAGHGPPPNC